MLRVWADRQSRYEAYEAHLEELVRREFSKEDDQALAHACLQVTEFDSVNIS